MLTYQDVVTVRLSPLTTAAAAWARMADGFEDLGEAYGTHVQGVAKGGVWVGESADAAASRYAVSRQQFDAAVVEARAIASILRDIHAQFVERIRAVTELVESARKAGLYVDATGRAHLDTSKADEAKGGLFDETARAANEMSWTTAVLAAVRAVDDADEGAKLALRDAAGIKDFFEEFVDNLTGAGHSFNASAVDDIEVVEAREAKKYADQLLAGKAPDDPEEYARLMRDNAGDERFSRTVLNHLGPEGTIKVTNQLNTLAYDSDTGSKQHYLGAERGLANALATATQDPKSPFYKDFQAGLKESGMKRYDWQGEKVRGYQSIVTLMQHGEGYSDQFMHDIGDDLIAVEKADKGNDNWDLPKSFVTSRDEWFANDPLDGLMGVMSKDPDASAAFLDPQSDSRSTDGGTKDGNDRLEYLTRHRDWDVVDGHPRMRSPFDPDTVWGDPLRHSDIDDAQGRAGFGAALVAGTTGIDPNNSGGGYVEHSEANNRVFEGALKHLSAEGDDMPPSLRTPMAVVMGNYGNEVHATASSQLEELSPLDRQEVLEVSKQISRDRFAYFTLQDSINREIVHDINTGEGGHEETWRRAGHTVGFLEEARYQGLAVDADDAKSKATWDAKMDYHTWGGVANFIPYGGDAAQRGVDVLTSKWLEGETEKIEEGRARDSTATSIDREGRVAALADIWRAANPDEIDGNSRESTISDINGTANDGNRTARGLAGKGS
ncbi:MULTISPECIES: hypothetical protein [Streptomyces]|uniref:hypothetical protein n=1 Tax=Streptomyces TaxID=1883 RepID=UPI000BF18B91|nr:MULTISPECIES: hypothetical protein [unclassified Streptomyces]WTE26800.1 hypothetical protein OHB50_14725 [Streptomyces anulatus]